MEKPSHKPLEEDYSPREAAQRFCQHYLNFLKRGLRAEMDQL